MRSLGGRQSYAGASTLPVKAAWSADCCFKPSATSKLLSPAPLTGPHADACRALR